MEKEDLAQIRAVAFRILAAREHSKLELRGKLQQRAFGSENIEQVIAELEAEGLQSDTRYVEMLLRSRANKGYGPARIRQELKSHYVKTEIIENVWKNHEFDWFESCLNVMQKKFSVVAKDDWKQQQKIRRHLSQRGFSEEHIKYALCQE